MNCRYYYSIFCFPILRYLTRRMMYISYTFNDKQARIYMSDVYTGPSASEIAYAVQRQLSSDFGSVHILSPGSNCITHFGAGFGFETPLDSCRNLCLMPEYRFVEVYTNSLKAISTNGAVANIDARGAGEAWRRLERQPAMPMSGPSEGFL